MTLSERQTIGAIKVLASGHLDILAALDGFVLISGLISGIISNTDSLTFYVPYIVK